MTTENSNRQLFGVGVSPGFAIGIAYLWGEAAQNAAPTGSGETTEIEGEFARFQRAQQIVRDDLFRLAISVEPELGTGLADIFRAHTTILDDRSLSREIRAELEENRGTVEQALQVVSQRWKARLKSSEHHLLRDRADDIDDLCARLSRALSGVREMIERIPRGCVLVTRRIVPSEIVLLRNREVAAIVVEHCGMASHAAILARGLSIPVVSRIIDGRRSIATGDTVAVDGITGRVIVLPDAAQSQKFRDRIEERSRTMQEAMEKCDQPAITIDGTRLDVMANIGGVEDAALCVQYGADAIGLLRLEQFYLARSSLPNEQQLSEFLRACFRPIEGLTMTIRLLDAGADKRLPYLVQQREANPLLGQRGVRLLLRSPKLLESQLRAIFAISNEHPLRILVPMVTLADDMRQIRESAKRVAGEMGISMLPPLGAMIETPAAALCAKDIAGFAEFLSIGTNDLTQYTMAAGRDEESLSNYYVDDHPAIMRLIHLVCSEATDKEVSICGELAGNPDAIPHLLGLGVRHLSVLPLRIPAVKERARNVRL